MNYLSPVQSIIQFIQGQGMTCDVHQTLPISKHKPALNLSAVYRHCENLIN